MSENSSFNESEEDEYPLKKASQRVSLRQRNTVSYSEKNFEELDRELEEEISSRPTRSKKAQNNYKKIIQQNVDDELEDEYSPNQDQKNKKTDKMDIEKDYEVGQQEPGGIFYPEIDQILFRKEKENEPGQFTYLVKYKEWSYLHVDWLDEKEVVVDSQPGKNKLNRFNKAFDKKVAEGEIDEEVLATERYFDPSYVEVDRILHTTELFPVIHPKKANEIKGKWTEILVLVVNKLLNFSKDTVHYGIHFAEPVNPDRDGCPNYKKMIPNPMDLGSLLNRLYLDYYKSPSQVWVDVGLVFKNCRKFNKDEESDIRILCDTLRECALYLYQQWHDKSKEKYEQMLHEYKMVYDETYKNDKLIEYNGQFDQELKSEEHLNNLKSYQRALEDFIKSKKDESQDLQDQLNDYISINKEKEGIKEDVIVFETYYNTSQAIKYQELDSLAKGFQLNEEYQNLVKEIMKKSQKQETSEEEKKRQEEEEEEEERKQQESEKNMTKEQQKEVYEKKKQQYKSLISQLTSEQKQKLQSDLNQQYKSTLQTEVQSAQKNGQKLNQEEYQKLQIQIKSRIQNQQLDKIRSLKKMIEENQKNPTKNEKKGVMKSVEEIEKFNPGDYTYDWIQEDRGHKQISEEFKDGYRYIGDSEFNQLSLDTELDRLYLVKWKNLSYLESTWEQESLIGCPEKIYDFKMYNRALDKESRGIMMQNNNRHKTLLDLENNPKKKAKLGQQAINDIKNKLFFYDISQRRALKQYTKENQTIYKDRKLLRYYQLESLNWMVDAWYNKRNVILADEMGLGKTIQTVSLLNHLHVHENCRGPFLVIAPLSTLEHWKRTVETWTNLNGVLYYDTQSQDGRSCLRYYEWLYTDISTKGTVLQTSEIYKFTVLITSNEVFMQDHQNILMNIPFQFIAVDEAHRLKNQNAKILTALKKMPCKRVLLLTGTPIQNNTEELFTLLNFIEPNKFNSIDTFKDNFGELKTKDQIENLQKMLKPYLLRRMKEDVEDSIPPLQETIIDIEMTTVQKALYRGIYEKNKTMLAKNFSSLATGASLNNLEMQLRKCCSHPFLIKEIEQDIDQQCQTAEQRYEQLINQSGKMILLDKLIMKFKRENTKVLIFSQFTYILSLIEEYLKYNRLKFEKIDGAVKARDRQNAIDRFNNPNKQRDVFLLSTKAGGLGINLTSANVVIIFDSDWNPQNDLQAIARAHRIGQTSEVMVYRFITRATYEAQMFERSTIKLGLDQAIFLGGEFKDAKGNDKTMKSKMDNKEVEILLKKGILGFVDDTEDAKKSQQFQEENIDQILLNNTRQANFSLVNGSYSFNKQAFVSKQTDVDINMDDPEFWNKILKGRDSQAQLLKDEFSKKQKDIESSLEQQKQFIWKLCDQINQLVESKLSGENYSADDERNINDILNTIISTKFHSKYQNLATNWLIECQRPTRRFRKMNLEDLELQNLSLSNNQLDKKGKKAMSGIDLDGDDEENLLYDEDEDFFSDNNGIGGDVGVPARSAAANGGGTAATNFKAIPADKKLRASDDMLRKLCYYCERINCTYICAGPCRRGFHENCKLEVEKIGNYISMNGPPQKDIKLTEDGLTEEQLRKLINKNANYMCPDCKKNQVVCFICKKRGPFYGNSKSKKKKKNLSQINIDDDVDAMEEEVEKDKDKKEESDEENQEEEKTQNPKEKSAQKLDQENDRSELIKCSTANCNKFYHLSCTDEHKLFKYIDPPANTRFRCSLHYCQKCSISGDSLTLAQCVRCHRSYHLKCFDKLDIKKLGKKVMICHRHDQSNAPTTNLLLNPSYNNSRKEKKKKDTEQVVLSEDSEGEENNQNAQQNQAFSQSNINQNHNKIQLNIDNEDLDLGDFVIQKKKKDKSKDNNNNNSKELNDKKYKKQKTEKGEIKKDRESSRSERDRERERDRDRDRERERERDKKRTTRHSQTKLDSYYSKSKQDSSDYSDANENEIAKYLSKKKEDKKKDKKSSNSSNNFTNKDTVPKYTYEQLGMPSPKNFDYTQYKQDWCRYCGARFSSNFTKGPWAPRTLCTVHYINWMQKKKLNLSQYKDLPTKPINPDDLNELLYISREKAKNPDFNPGEELSKKLAESLNQQEEDIAQEEQEIQQAIEDQAQKDKIMEEGEAESLEDGEANEDKNNNKNSEKSEQKEKEKEKEKEKSSESEKKSE